MRVFIIFFMLMRLLWAHGDDCIYLPCDSAVASSKSKSQESINKAYEETNKEIDETLKKYKETKVELEKVNEKLNLRLRLLKNEALEDERILFLLEKFNHLKGTNISQKGIK